MTDTDSEALTQKQLTALEQLKTAVADVLQPYHDDYYLLRWLRARNYDPIKAEKMLRASLEWRKTVGADTITEDYEAPEVLKKYYPVGFPGYDREGCPVWIICFGNIDLKGLLCSAKKTDLIRYTIQFLETSYKKMQEQSEKYGRRVCRQVGIIDLENFGMKHISWKPAVDLILEIVQIHEANYPELLKAAFIVNTPKVFSILWALVRPFLHEVTVSKIKIFGRGDKWREALLECIDPTDLPVHWGGTKTDENDDPRCRSLICLGGDVPQSYYMAPANRLLESENVQLVTVNKGSTLKIEKQVPVAGSVLRWEFKTEEYDISFGVYFKTDKGLQEVIPKQRVNSQLVPEDGICACSQAGTYVLCFDNSFSLFRSKKLAYTLEVMEPSNTTDSNYIFENGSDYN